MRTDEFFVEPMLAPTADVRLQDGVVKVEHPSGGLLLKGLPPQYVAATHGWLADSRAAHAPAHGIPAALARRVLASLDSGGMLVDAGAQRGDRTGVAVMSRVEMGVAECRRGLAPQADRLDTPELRERQLMGNAIEYYFVTLAACEAVAPALARVPASLKSTMAQFVLEEYRHDLILARALAPYGLTAADLEHVVPLPYTSAVTNQLFMLAHTDPLSLMACLFIVEGTPAEGRRYLDWLSQVGAPESYIDSHGEHDRINTNGAHGTISRRCFRALEFVSAEDEARIVHQACGLVRLMWSRSRQMIEYYGDIAQPSPRFVHSLDAAAGAPAMST